VLSIEIGEVGAGSVVGKIGLTGADEVLISSSSLVIGESGVGKVLMGRGRLTMWG
jgi:hypothetical protein